MNPKNYVNTGIIINSSRATEFRTTSACNTITSYRYHRTFTSSKSSNGGIKICL